MFNLFELIQKLAQIPGGAGDESRIRDELRALAAPFADEIEVDALGNLIVTKYGVQARRQRIMVAAHMDSVGLIVTHIDENGFLRFGGIGGLAPVNLLHVPVRFASGARGVIAKDEKADLKGLRLSDLYIDIGASSREEAAKQVKVSDTATYATETFRAGENRIVSPCMDNRVGCAVLLLALEALSEPEHEIVFVFTAQEELGVRGARTAAFRIEPAVGIAVDVTRTGDTPDPAAKMECSLGAGAAIKVMDSSMVCAPELVRALAARAVAEGIPHQYEVLERGGNDASAIQQAQAGTYAGAISIPTRYIHTPAEMIDERDVRAAVSLLVSYLSGKNYL
ncbi:M20/M25/M40 family metallo-hydrolase [Oscillospiraceae bacterium OttesenSCG-928-G22]|nr:M20/M25/M40 family metallo-hydrolase [Oscillospiraceae bacterium OttesenSCG-928-G22]